MFPWKRAPPERAPWPTIVALLAIVVLYQIYEWQTARLEHYGTHGRVETLSASPSVLNALGRAGDLVLQDEAGPSITIVAAPNIEGHPPLLGAIVDAVANPRITVSPLLWIRAATEAPTGKVTYLAERTPQPFTCEDGSIGVRGYGAYAVALTATTCAAGNGRFILRSKLDSLPEGSTIIDELNLGSRAVVVSGDGAAWGTEHDTTFVAAAYGGTAVILEAPHMHVSRILSHPGEATFPPTVIVRYGDVADVTRTLHILRGDVLDAIATLPEAKRSIDVTFGENRGGEISVRDAADRELASGIVARGKTRTLDLPGDFGDHLVLRDDRGVLTDAHAPLSGSSIHAATAAVGDVSLEYEDDRGAPLPVHVLVKGIDGTPDPEPAGAAGRTVVAGRSLYLLDGRTRVTLAVGSYRFTASHGTTYSLSVREVSAVAGRTNAIHDSLGRVLDTSGWVSADFNLHSAASPDSDVSRLDLVNSLACEGLDLAVATDHDRVTDFAPDVRALGLSARLATAPGVEITSAGQRWGHFNAYPLPPPSGAPERGVPMYFDRRPAEIFASARYLGARVIQIDHARMDPMSGYFDLAHFDPRTGRSSPEFSLDFDTLEAFDGTWLERPKKIRQGPVDAVGLARRGKRVAIVGSSDLHDVLYGEPGYPRTFIHVACDPVVGRVGRVVRALLGVRDTTVTSGPFVEMSVEGHPVGSVVTPGSNGSVEVHVRVSAPSWVPVDHVEIWRDDAVFLRLPVPGPPKDGIRFEGTFYVPIEGQDATILAWADADSPLPDVVPGGHALSVGFTGLVYVDADRDGKIAVPSASP